MLTLTLTFVTIFAAVLCALVCAQFAVARLSGTLARISMRHSMDVFGSSEMERFTDKTLAYASEACEKAESMTEAMGRTGGYDLSDL